MRTQYIVTYKEKGAPAKDWLICWTCKAAFAEAQYRQRVCPEYSWRMRIHHVPGSQA